MQKKLFPSRFPPRHDKLLTDCKEVDLMKWNPRQVAAEHAKNEASFWPGLSLRSNRKPVPDQRSTLKKTAELDELST